MFAPYIITNCSPDALFHEYMKKNGENSKI